MATAAVTRAPEMEREHEQIVLANRRTVGCRRAINAAFRLILAAVVAVAAFFRRALLP
jgi:hypothetical protein